MKSLKDYENVEIKSKGKQLRFQIAVILFFLLIFISIFTLVRRSPSQHSSQEVVKSFSVQENIKKSEPVKKEKKPTKSSPASQQKVVPSKTVEAPETPSEASSALVNNNSQTMPEAPQSANNSLIEQSDTEQELRQQAIDEANQKAEEIAQSLASSAQEEGYIVNIERQ